MITLGVCLTAMLVGLASDNGRFPWTIGLISSLPLFVVAWCAARETHLLNPYALFSAAYGAYNGLLLLRFAFLDRADLPYPLQLTNESMIAAGLLSAYGSMAIALAWVFRIQSKKPLIPNVSGTQRKACARVGVLFSVSALVLFLAQVRQFGGFATMISIDRVQRYQLMEDHFSFPYISFANIGVAMLILGSANDKFWRRTAWSVVAFWLVIFALQGDRRLILQILLTSMGVIASLKPSTFRIRIVTIVALLVAVFLALGFGKLRPLISIYMQQSGQLGSSIWQQQIALSPLDLIMPENNELGGPYASVLDATCSSKPLLWGRSYLDTLPAFLPRALYPGIKPKALANELADRLSQGDMFAMGWGYSPVSEAYRNFGASGVPIIMAGWAALFLWLTSIQHRPLWGILLSSSLLQDAVSVNRIDFRTTYLEVAFNVAIALLGLFFSKLETRRVRWIVD